MTPLSEAVKTVLIISALENKEPNSALDTLEDLGVITADERDILAALIKV